MLVTCPLESVSAEAGVKVTPDGPLKINSRSGNAASGSIIYLHDDRLVQRHSDIANLLATA